MWRLPWPRVRSPLSMRVRLVLYVWAVLLVVCELLLFHGSIALCALRWPSVPASSSKHVVPVRVALVADPQLTDRFSYGTLSLSEYNASTQTRAMEPTTALGTTQWVIEYMSDLYMARAFYVLQLYARPHAVFFLGDLMDGGREERDDARWLAEFDRFRSVFRPRLGSMRAAATATADVEVVDLAPHGNVATLPHRRNRGYTQPLMFYTPGNHDVGIADSLGPAVRERYARHFGPSSYAVALNGVSFVVLDTLDLSLDAGGSMDDIKDAATKNVISTALAESPRGVDVLITHMPLYRPPQSPCGPLRHAPPLRDGSGYQYKNLQSKLASSFLLSALKPQRVFSGDDHHPCTYQHNDRSTEHSVGTFSWMQGNLRPSFGMLTAAAAAHAGPSGGGGGGGTLTAYDECVMPNQIAIYYTYAAVFVATIVLYTFSCFFAVPGGLDASGRLPSIPLPIMSSSMSRGSLHGRVLLGVFHPRKPHRNDLNHFVAVALRLVLLYLAIHIVQWAFIFSVPFGLPDQLL